MTMKKAIAEARELNKAHSTFIDSITKHAVNGRIHADINQIRSDAGGTVTGRFSMSNPNHQQIPPRNKELGPKIRSIVIPEVLEILVGLVGGASVLISSPVTGSFSMPT